MKEGGLPYYGGKSPIRGTTKWIVSHLPWDYRSLYVEPFCGMCGVLLSRPPVCAEMINDRDDRLINWWRVIRDHPEEFGRQLDWTHQHSRTEFVDATADLHHEDPIRRAVAFTICTQGSMQKTAQERGGQWAKRFQPTTPASRWETPDVMRLRERTKFVQIENMDAVKMLGTVEEKEDAVVYCDPPYESSDNSNYKFTPDWDALKETLRKQKGKVAISGFHDDFDDLGWRCETLNRSMGVYDAVQRKMEGKARVEKLWMNYDPPQGNLLLCQETEG